MAFQLAIFDFDGTLADSFPSFLLALNEAAARFGFRGIDEADVERLRGFSSWQVLEHIDIAMWQVPMVTSFVRHRMAELADGVSLFPGIHEAVEDLAAAGVRLAVVSSNSEASIRHILGGRLASLVHDYRGDVSIFGKRPKFRQVLASAGIPAARAIAIGDEIRDLKAARAEGIRFAAVAWGFTAAPALLAAQPELMFMHAEDIVPAVAGAPTRPAPRG